MLHFDQGSGRILWPLLMLVALHCPECTCNNQTTHLHGSQYLLASLALNTSCRVQSELLEPHLSNLTNTKQMLTMDELFKVTTSTSGLGLIWQDTTNTGCSYGTRTRSQEMLEIKTSQTNIEINCLTTFESANPENNRKERERERERDKEKKIKRLLAITREKDASRDKCKFAKRERERERERERGISHVKKRPHQRQATTI